MDQLINVLIVYILISMSVISVYIFISKSLLAIAVVSGVFSILNAIFYLLIGAPDVALTETVVGAGVSTTLYLLTILLTKPSNKSYIHININKSGRFLKITLITILVTAMLLLVIVLSSLPQFGSLLNPTINETYFTYVTQSYEVYGIKNIITMILGSFRGYDTLGEVIVIFTGAIAVTALIKQGKSKN